MNFLLRGEVIAQLKCKFREKPLKAKEAFSGRSQHNERESETRHQKPTGHSYEAKIIPINAQVLVRQ